MIWWLTGIFGLTAALLLWRATYLGCRSHDLEIDGNLWASSVSAQRSHACVVAAGVFIIAAFAAGIIGIAGLWA